MNKKKAKAGAAARKRSAKIFLWAMVGGVLSIVAALVAAGMMDPSTNDASWVGAAAVFSQERSDPHKKFFRANPSHRPWRRFPFVKEK